MPEHSGQKISHTELSKLYGAFCSNAPCSVGGDNCEPQCTMLQALRCSIITPFGVPVEPEV
ncbi:hypothetical protein D3C81_1313750 [compost metagenome]